MQEVQHAGAANLVLVAQRDPMAYRPFAEFCMGLPTRMFMRDGEMRWMAKQMARGIMPEEQAANSLNGRWDADWHLRIKRRRAEFRAEFERMAQHPTLGPMIDTERMIQALDDFPAQTSTDPQVWLQVELGIPRALLTARFVDFVERTRQGFMEALTHENGTLVVAHGGNLRVLSNGLRLELPPEMGANASPLLFERAGAGWSVTRVGRINPLIGVAS